MKNHYKIKYSPLFYSDLEEIISYIIYKLNNPKVARDLMNKIEKAILERSYSPEGYEKSHIMHRKERKMEIGKHSLESENFEEGNTSELGLHTITHGFEKDIEATITKVIDGSLRSGKRIEFKGTLVILGDVNAGAEVIAEEHIIILGTLRGLAHAGAKGNRKAIIAANEIDATQIRIANIVKEMERPVYDYDEFDDDENSKEDKKDSKKRGKNKKQDDILLEEEYYDDYIKTRAYIKDNEIVLE